MRRLALQLVAFVGTVLLMTSALYAQGILPLKWCGRIGTHADNSPTCNSNSRSRSLPDYSAAQQTVQRGIDRLRQSLIDSQRSNGSERAHTDSEDSDDSTDQPERYCELEFQLQMLRAEQEAAEARARLDRERNLEAAGLLVESRQPWLRLLIASRWHRHTPLA